MESKSKTFARKLVALFLSVIMALSCFTGAMTAFANSKEDYHDANLASNFMAWAEATDEQTAEALLDYADLYLGDLMEGLLGSTHINFELTSSIKIDGYLDSIDGVINLVRQADGLLSDFVRGVIGGDVKNVQISAFNSLAESSNPEDIVSGCNKSYRAVNDAKDIIMCVAQLLYENSNDFGGKNVLGQFVKGKLNLGSILENNVLKGNVYGLLQQPLGLWDGYQSNLVYNIVANLIWENTNWYTDAEVAAFKNDLSTWNFDVELFGKLSSELLNKINVLVTYPTRVPAIDIDKKSATYGQVLKNTDGSVKYIEDHSGLRKYKIDKYMADNNVDYATAAEALGYDANLVYSSEPGFENNILLFQYGNKKLSVTKDDTLFSVAFKAMEIAWDTVLKGTLGLVHVNYNEGDGKKTDGYIGGSNFDNAYYYWMCDNNKWDENAADWKTNYTTAKVNEWANAVYADYGCASAEEFIEGVKKTYSFDRRVVENPKNNWQDINATKLFNQLRYSPLADVAFNMQTGPINLYFQQTGIKDIEKFFSTVFTDYSDMVAAFNDALVAVTKVVFPESANIGLGDGKNNVVTDLTVPEMKKTGNTQNADTISTTLVGNVFDMIEYVANTTNENILAPFYTKNNITTKADNLTEQNAEEAMLPLLITCINQITMVDPIHDEKWDSCGDFESVGYIALEEYLSYVLPDKDYSQLISYNDEGKIVPGVDHDGDGNKTMLEDVLMPMARDAVGYFLNYIVPCRDKDGNRWDVYESDVMTDKTTLFDILNSVVCYYASTENFSDDNTTGKAVASLLGCVEKNGECQIKMSNTLWQNLDAVINKLFPIVGELQYGAEGSKADSKDLIYNNIITGILEIGPTNGVTTLIRKLITTVTADPISKKGIDVMVYDNMVAPLLNALFGARYDGQGYINVIPYSEYYDRDKDMNDDGVDSTSSATPFDSLLQMDTIGYYSAGSNGNDDGQATGPLGILICNIFEFFGGGSYKTSAKAGADGCWQGTMFAVSAVSSIIPSFIPQLSEHTLKAATAEVENASQSSLAGGSNFSTKIKVNNNSIGLNRFYRENGTVKQKGRYFINIKNVTIDSNNGQNTISVSGASNVNVAPEESVTFNVSGTVPNVSSTLYTFNVIYDIYEAKMNGTSMPSKTDADSTIVETDQVTKAYLYLSTEKDWRNTLYSRDYNTDEGTKQYDGAYEPGANSSSEYTTSTALGGSTVYVAFQGNKSPLYATVPKNFIVPMTDPSSVERLLVRIRNERGSDRSTDGVYVYPKSGTEYYSVSNGTVSSTITKLSEDDNNLAYAAIDKATGNIINYNLYDYTTEAMNGEWNRGEVCADTTDYDKSTYNTKNMHQGYTQSQIDNLPEDVKKSEGFTTRPHVVWTFNEALEAGIVKGVQRTAAAADSSGNITYAYESVFVQPTTLLLAGTAVSEGHTSISFGTPTPGLYLTAAKTTVAKNSTSYIKWIAYDGTTELKADAYDMNIDFYTTNNNNMKASIHMIIADDTAANTLNKAYSSGLEEMSVYAPEDYKDADVYTNLNNAFADALSAVSTTITAESAPKLGSDMITVANTNETTEEYGDPAYKPISTSVALPASVQINATKGNDGYWYYNEECTMPVYSNEALTDADVTNGKDPAGQDVVKVDGVWYLANAAKCTTEWDTTTYEKPYLKTTNTPVVNDLGQTVREEIRFVYRDVNGEKVRSTDKYDDGTLKWVYKFAESKTVIRPNDEATKAEYRGIYQRSIDNLAYWMEQAKANIKADFAKNIAEQVSKTRQNMNNVNHNVATYEKMVQVARSAESLIQSSGPNGAILDADGNATYEYTSTASSMQIKEAIRLFNFYNDLVIDRNYIGDKLEAEITCATSPNKTEYTYADFTQTSVTETVTVPEVVDETTGAVITPASTKDVTTYTVKGNKADMTAEYGAYNAEGVLVNEGETKYTAESWTNYVNALGAAIELAETGNTDPTDPSAAVSRIYTAKTDLQKAENNLEEATDAGTITVSGQIVIATDVAGDNGDVGIVGIDVKVGDEVVATSAADGTFTATVPAGTTELTIAGETTIDRTVTIAGTADVADVVIPIIVCDYNHDGEVNSTDKSVFNTSYNKPDAFNVYCDLSGDGEVNSTDKSLFNTFYNKAIGYTALELA